MDYKAIIKDIQNKKFEKIYFLHGEEGFFIDEITNALIENVLEPHEKDFNQAIIYGKDADVLSVVSEAKGYPMMASRKLVIVKEAQEIKDKDFTLFESYLDQPSELTVFVINYKHKTFDTRKKLAKSAAKNGLMFKSDKVKDYLLAEWISNYVKSVGYGISSKASILLAEFLGSNLSKISNELDKLFILLEKGTTINEIHVEENIGISKDFNPFELINAISVRDVNKAYQIAKYFEHNPKAGDIHQVIPSAFGFFSKIMKVHFLSNKTKDAVATALKVHPFVASQMINASKVYNPKKIASNIAILHEYDLKSKGINNSSFPQNELMREMLFRLLH
ncbi:DNA polymerase III subunit delta [Crocinitomicaceae bacterium]|nr:DNA polymerase III subunit delta [Crocinitomicaceae bacterium]